MQFRPYNPFQEIGQSRRNLPHWQQDGACYFITFRLGDSLPQTLLKQWRDELETWMSDHPKPWTAGEEAEYEESFTERRQRWLDAGYGECQLRRPDIRELVHRSLMKFDQVRYDLDAFVIMPNHVHLLLQLRPGFDLSKELKGLKGGSARACNLALGLRGSFWMDESYDRVVRDVEELNAFRRYISGNPGKAHLASVHYSLYEAHILQA
jgi:putative transposase